MSRVVILLLLVAVIILMTQRHNAFKRALKAVTAARVDPPDPIIDRYGHWGTIRIYDGERPVCHHVLPTEENHVLVELTWRVIGLASIDGVMFLSVDRSTITRSGDAHWYRLFTSEEIGLLDGTISTREGANMVLNTTRLEEGGPIAIPRMTLSTSTPERVP